MATKAQLEPIDRSGWERGQWDGEPDRAEWKTAAGLPALAVRSSSSGVWCGYVAVAQGHPLYDHKDIFGTGLEVHGGITYADRCAGQICHVPAPGEPDDVFWLGFDCGHAYDATPGRDALFRKIGRPELVSCGIEIYRTLDYVKNQCERLAEQLIAKKEG